MPGFFIKGSAGKKRKVTPNTKILSKKLSKEIQSDDESVVSGDEQISNASESEEESAQEKRLRLAKEYISQIQQEELEKKEEKDFDKDAISHRLQQDVDEEAGRLQTFIANQVVPNKKDMVLLRGHKLSITSVVISTDGKYIFSASKDGTIIKWDSETKKKVGKISAQSKNEKEDKSRHLGQVLCLALSTDFKYLVSAGHDKLIYVWDPETMKHIHTFKGHRNIITCLSFQLKKHQLFSGSNDKTIKVWNLDEMSYVETLFGHEDSVLGVSSLLKDRVVSCGGRDRSVRLWKIPEESQLVFQSSKGSSFDCLTMMNDEYFLTGGDDGSLSIFHIRKKKPITLRTNAHKNTEEEKQPLCDESWITAVASIPFTDLVASGSCDGYIKLWRCEKSFRSLMPVQSITMTGFINSLQFSADGKQLIAGIGQEHRLGRWWKIKDAKNSICIIPLVYSEET